MFSENRLWMVIKSTPIKRAPLLKSILSSRFPHLQFEYLRFSSKSFRSKKQPVSGLIAELKLLREKSLPSFDRMLKTFEGAPMVLILSPASYQLLEKRRPTKLSKHTVLMSEPKSLSYMMQLPRVMEDLISRQELLAENLKLEKQIRGSVSQSFDEELPVLGTDLKEALGFHPGKLGIQIQIKKWKDLKRRLGEVGQSELMTRLFDQISRAVRQDDRILRTDENELTVFVSNIQKKQLKTCEKRVSEVLSQIKISTEKNKALKLPFAIRRLEDLAFNS